ncbi:MAG: hypothetical protein JWL95_2668 [Gemmatimonadetes bacterium]|nr:hypothetical protein [Gemmatimonadota bacterium]
MTRTMWMVARVMLLTSSPTTATTHAEDSAGLSELGSAQAGWPGLRFTDRFESYGRQHPPTDDFAHVKFGHVAQAARLNAPTVVGVGRRRSVGRATGAPLRPAPGPAQ